MSVEMQSPEGYDDNPEWTAEEVMRARPSDEVLPAWAAAALVRHRGGRPAGSTKEQVSLRVDRDALARWRASGAGWQSRMNDVLRRASHDGVDLVAAARAQGVGARWPSLAA